MDGLRQLWIDSPGCHQTSVATTIVAQVAGQEQSFRVAVANLIVVLVARSVDWTGRCGNSAFGGEHVVD